MAKLIACPHCGGDLEGMEDGRAGWWRFRVRLFDHAHSYEEPMAGADSDRDLEPDAPGVTVVRGVWRVLSETAEAASSWHGEPLVGLGKDTLDLKERGIRSTLWRNKGRGTIKIPYDTLDSFSESRDHEPRYLARVTMEKADPPTQ